MSNFMKYFILGIIFWVVTDFTTTAAIRSPGQYYTMFMPVLFIFYIGYPLFFSFLIYKIKLQKTWLFGAMLGGAFIVEIVFTHNALLYTFPLMLLALPVAVLLYSFITYVPKWIVDRQLKENKGKLGILTGIWILVSLITVFGTVKVSS